MYDSCTADGFYKTTEEINRELISSLLADGKSNIECAQLIMNSIPKSSALWKNVFKNYYDSLHAFAEALLYLQNLKSTNHQCLFAAVCTKYAHLELDWEFLDQIRAKRNGIGYYGENFTYDDWKKIELQLKLYCSTLQKELQSKLV